jgi:hypothetical protein
VADSPVYQNPVAIGDSDSTLQKESLLSAAKGATFGVLALLDMAGEPDLVAQASRLHIEIVRRWRERV